MRWIGRTGRSTSSRPHSTGVDGSTGLIGPPPACGDSANDWQEDRRRDSRRPPASPLSTCSPAVLHPAATAGAYLDRVAAGSRRTVSGLGSGMTTRLGDDDSARGWRLGPGLTT